MKKYTSTLRERPLSVEFSPKLHPPDGDVRLAPVYDALEAAVALEAPFEGAFPGLEAQVQRFIARLRTAE